jgi:hypothetical protein
MSTTIDISTALQQCHAKIEALKKLHDGWHDGYGLAISETASTVTHKFLDERPNFADVYRIYPTENGGLLIEAIIADWDLSLEIEPTGHLLLYGCNLKTCDDLEPFAFTTLTKEFLTLFDTLTKPQENLLVTEFAPKKGSPAVKSTPKLTKGARGHRKLKT